MQPVELKMNLPPDLSEDEARLFLAIKLYELEKTSLGQAAKLAGFSKSAFMEILGRYQIPSASIAAPLTRNSNELAPSGSST